MSHEPVMLDEVLAHASTRPGEVVLDATFGGGGYTRAFLSVGVRKVIAVDRDPDAIARGRPLVEDAKGRLHLHHGPFSSLEAAVHGAGEGQVDVVVFDLGVSSFQLDDAGRGFSFRRDGPLDMRMAREGLSAAEALLRLTEQELARILTVYGEEPAARRLAKVIVAERQKADILNTLALVDLVDRAGVRGTDGRNPATRAFQALRIFLNDECGELASGLLAAERVLKPGGRLVVVSFHSLEDRIVKAFFSVRSGHMPRVSRHTPPSAELLRRPSFELASKKPVVPGAEEEIRNPRSRSAKLRAGRRTDQPGFPDVVPTPVGVPSLAELERRR